MGASERAAALRRARERQARIESATTRVMKASAELQRAQAAKAQAMLRCDERVARAEEVVDSETAELAKVCRSAEAAAEILARSTREVRRVIKIDRERQGEYLMALHVDTDPLWDVSQVSAYLKVPVRTLYRWRTYGYGPPGRRVGRHLRYRASEVIAWYDNLDENERDRWE